jgi:hypothetical protein
MKAAPTLDGRVRIDPESEIDLVVLRAIVSDAQGSSDDLVASLGHGMDEAVTEDWADFVRPELEDRFSRQLADVSEDLSTAQPGEPIFVGPERVDSWYGALNQARLALEEKHQFGDEELESMSAARASAKIRSHFYGALQYLMLEILFPPDRA